MVAISMYRGNLHRVSDAPPREWPMPPRAITLQQFRDLTRRRERALARLAAADKTPHTEAGDSREKEEGEREAETAKEEEAREEGELKSQSESVPRGIEVKDEAKEDGDSEMADASANAEGMSSIDAQIKGPDVGRAGDAKAEVSINLTEKQKRKAELETKLEVLNQKKHHLVQMLKQILNAEEEIKRRNTQAAILRSSIPPQADSAADAGSATRQVPKLSVEVNFTGESDATVNHSTHGHPMHHVHNTSPSGASVRRPFQQNTALTPGRSSLAVGIGQTQSSVLLGNSVPAATSSPSRFAPSGNQGHHHSASMPPVSNPSFQFMASSPSPAASGGASSVFRDSRVTSSS